MRLFHMVRKYNSILLGIAFYALLFFPFGTIFSQNISEDTLKINEVHVSARRSIEEVGIIKSKIDTSIIKASESENLSELLSENTPVFVKSAGRGALATVSFRGTSASHTDVLWNGMTIKSPMFGEVDFSLIPMFFIDDVSLLHGGASMQSSTGALGGAIQIDNKPDWNNQFSLRFKQDFGSYSTFNDFLQFNIGNKKIQSKTRLFYSFSENDFEYLNSTKFGDNNAADLSAPIKVKNKNADYLQYGLMQEVYYRFKDRYVASFKYWGQKTDRALPRLNTYEGNQYSNISKQVDLTHRAIAQIERFGDQSKFQLTSGFILKDMEYYMRNFVSGSGYQNLIYSNSHSESLYNKIQYSYDGLKGAKITTQYEFNLHKVFSKDTVLHYAYDKTNLEHLLFASWQQKINKNWSSTLIIRQNFIGDKVIPITPYLGLDYLVSEKYQVIAKASISRNYRVPTLNDLYWQPGGNEDLKPEKGWSSDLALSSKFSYRKVDIDYSAGLFYSNITDWILWVYSPLGFQSPENMRRVESKGIELHLNLHFKIKKVDFKFNTNYAFTKSVNKDRNPIWGDGAYNKQLIYLPLHSYNLFGQAKWKQYFFNYQHNSYSTRYTTTNNSENPRDVLVPYFMNNIALGRSFKLKKYQIDLSAKVYNLFNESYRSILGRSMPGWNYLLSASIKF